MRNVLKQAEQGKEIITESRDLTSSELQQLVEILKDGNSEARYNSLVTAFYFGVSVGQRQEASKK